MCKGSGLNILDEDSYEDVCAESHCAWMSVGGRHTRLSLEDGGIDTKTVDHEYFDHDVCC
jgi:hypothetical protein